RFPSMVRTLRAAFVALAGLPLAPFALDAQVDAGPLERSAHRVGTVIIAHGGDSSWNAGVIDVARAVRTGGPVEVSFLMGPGAAKAPFQRAVERLVDQGATEVVVVP